MKKDWIASTFTSGEIEAVTGVTAVQQRNYRRQEYLPRREDRKWTRFTLHETAMLLVMSRLSDAGIPPGFGSVIANTAAVQVRIFALQRPGALDDPAGETSGPPIKTSKDFGKRFLVMTGRANPAPSYEYTNDLRDAFDGFDNECPARVVIDLRGLGAVLAQRARRPLMRFAEAD